MIISGSCPHCGEAVQCGVFDKKIAARCPYCDGLLFDRALGWLRVTNVCFFLSLLPALVGVAMRSRIGLWGCAGSIALSAACLFAVIFIERAVCRRQLAGGGR